MKTAFWLVTAFILIIVGIIIICGAMASVEWDISKLQTAKHETNEYVFKEDINNITIITNTASVAVTASEHNETKVVCNEEEKVKHNVFLKDDSLFVEVEDTRKWFERIGFSFEKTVIKLYLPVGEYKELVVKNSTGNVVLAEDFTFESIDITVSTGDVKNNASASEFIKIKTSTGNIDIEKATAKKIELKTSTGKIKAIALDCVDLLLNVDTGRTTLDGITCASLLSDGNTGSITLKNVIAEDKLSVTRSTGNVKFEECDGGEILVETDTGYVSGTLLTEKVFITKTDTGKINVPDSISGGRCEVTTDTGNINISIK